MYGRDLALWGESRPFLCYNDSRKMKPMEAENMERIRFAVGGTGWRSLCYVRIARWLP